MARADAPVWGCVEPGCDAHPANPDNGGPIFRLSPKGQPFVGACSEHFAKHDAPANDGWEVWAEDDIPAKGEA